MKAKEIVIGDTYTLARTTNSRPGLSMKYFKIFKGNELVVVESFLGFDNRNTVRIQGIHENKGKPEMVSFWCHPYDLEEVGYNQETQ